MAPRIVIDADLKLDFDNHPIAVHAAGSVINFELESFDGLTSLSKTFPTWRSQRYVQHWLTTKRVSVRVSVKQMVVAVIGRKTEDNGFSVAVGKGLRIWPFRLAGAMWQK
jgi:hypothetical protein